MDIEYKGKSYTFVVDFATISKVCQRANIKLSQFNSEFFDQPANIEIIFEEGLKRGARINNEKLELTAVDFENIIVDNINTIFGTIKTSMGGDQDQEPEDSKKN